MRSCSRPRGPTSSRAGADNAPQRSLLAQAHAACSSCGRACCVRRAAAAAVSAQLGWSALVRKLGLTRLLPRDLRELEPQTPRVQREVFQRTDRRHRSAAWRSAIPGRAAHRLRAGSGIFRCQSRHGGCAARQWLRSITPPRAVLLRLAACAQWRARIWPRELARRNDRPVRRSSRLDAIITNAGGCGSHLEALREPARRRSGLCRDARNCGTPR